MARRMKAAIFVEPGRIVLDDKPVPDPGPLDALGAPTPSSVAPAASDSVLTSGLRQTVGSQGSSIPALATITGLMTDPQFRVVIRALDQRGALELMAAPRVTTLSGRQAQVIINDAREKALKIVDQANRRSGEIIEEARSTAMSEGQRLVSDARQEAALEKARARDQLRRDVGSLAVAGASRLLQREIDPKAHADLIEQLAREIETAKA